MGQIGWNGGARRGAAAGSAGTNLQGCAKKGAPDRIRVDEFRFLEAPRLGCRPPLPGDYFVTPAGAIDEFMIRMKHSLRDAREMLSNTAAFWNGTGTRPQELGGWHSRYSRPDDRLSGRSAEMTGDLFGAACCRPLALGKAKGPPASVGRLGQNSPWLST
jgi:hypothetical protein